MASSRSIARGVAAPSSHARSRSLIRYVMQRLEERYGRPKWPGAQLDPVSELVAVILSQNPSDVNSRRAFEALRRRYPEWQAVIDAPTAELEDTIRAGGLARTKAPRIQGVLRLIIERRGSLDLEFLRNLPLREARDWLAALPGIGPKSAAIVLLFSLGRPALPVDTHVYRVARRLGLLPPGTDAAAAHDILQDELREEEVYPFHVELIRHGRDTCRAPRPRCHLCPLTERCAYYREFAASPGGRVAPARIAVAPK